MVAQSKGVPCWLLLTFEELLNIRAGRVPRQTPKLERRAVEGRGLEYMISLPSDAILVVSGPVPLGKQHVPLVGNKNLDVALANLLLVQLQRLLKRLFVGQHNKTLARRLAVLIRSEHHIAWRLIYVYPNKKVVNVLYGGVEWQAAQLANVVRLGGTAFHVKIQVSLLHFEESTGKH